MTNTTNRSVDAGAAYAEGMRLLREPGGAGGFVRGVDLIEAAAAAGHAEANARCALFEAMGIARAQNWELAFDRLQYAAEAGSRDAREQLVLLANADEQPQASGPAPAGCWARLRGSISLERLISHPESVALSTAHPIRTIQRFASDAECRYMINRARALLKPATVVKKTGEQTVVEGRSNSSAEFLEYAMDVVLEVIRTRIGAAIRVPPPMFEVTQILHYSVGQEFALHHDYLDPENPAHLPRLRAGGQRIATFLIYLNEDFDGGETDFPQIGLQYRGRTGDAVFWANLDARNRPNPSTLHAGLPPTSGEKWILSQWIRDRVHAPQAGP